MVQHPWHEGSIGTNSPEVVNAIIEIPRGSKAKYEIDKESGPIKLDRVIYEALENKKVVVDDFLPKEDAMKIIQTSINYHKEVYGK